jgi:hypothetical protein
MNRALRRAAKPGSFTPSFPFATYGSNLVGAGAQTSNTLCGRGELDGNNPGVLVVTNSLITATTPVFAWMETYVAGLFVNAAVPAAGSITITTNLGAGGAPRIVQWFAIIPPFTYGLNQQDAMVTGASPHTHNAPYGLDEIANGANTLRINTTFCTSAACCVLACLNELDGNNRFICNVIPNTGFFTINLDGNTAAVHKISWAIFGAGR